ncbi:hypothetical protein ACU8KH_05483 [Lachancea thermotolerans]
MIPSLNNPCILHHLRCNSGCVVNFLWKQFLITCVEQRAEYREKYTQANKEKELRDETLPNTALNDNLSCVIDLGASRLD